MTFPGPGSASGQCPAQGPVQAAWCKASVFIHPAAPDTWWELEAEAGTLAELRGCLLTG